jgi:hypothetical protein
MNHPIQCRCGQLKGSVAQPRQALHAVCYCTDCQAYAHALGDASRTLDALGGTEVAATQARHVTFSSSATLACMSLSPAGLLRWYAACCNTPIANTPRNFNLPYVGLVHTCLAGGPDRVAADFGPVRMRVNRKTAHGPVPADTAGGALAMLRFMPAMALNRVFGGHKATPFFNRAGEPVVAPRVLTREERAQATQAALAPRNAA